MTDQMNSIESLQTEVNQVKIDLDLLKAETNETIKQTKAESLEQDVSATKEKIKKELDALKGLTDATSLENARKLEAMLLTLETSNTELATLKVDVSQNNVSDTTPEEDEEVEGNEEEDGEEEKSDRNRIQRQWDGATSKEEWKNNTGANIARVAGGIGVLAVGVRGIKKLFGRGKKNKEKKESEGSEKSEEPGFWKSKFGKILKWTGIGTGTYYVVHGIATGKWHLKDFFDWEKEGAENYDESEDQIDSYEEYKENHPEDAEKYEALGGNVDELYENIFSKELDAGREDDADMDTIGQKYDTDEDLKGLVPYCMDNSFSSVDSMLSERGIEVDLWQKNNTEIKEKILGGIKNSTGKALKSFLESLPSWTQFAVGKSFEEKLESWINEDSEKRVLEIKFFFRQQIRVTTYLQQKKHTLIKKIAQEKINVNNSEGFADVEEALNDGERIEKEVFTDMDYISFNQGGILNAIDILRKKNVFDSELDEETQEVVDEVDLQRDDILDGTCGPDIIARCETDMEGDEKLESNNAQILVGSCQKIIKDITDDIEGPMEESMWNIYGDLANTNDSQLREILKESPFLDMFREIKKGFEDMIAKIQNGTFTKEDLKTLKNVINNYFAFKKELLIGANTFENIKDENGNRIVSIGKFLRGCLKNMREGMTGGHGFWGGAAWIATGAIPLFVVVRGVLYVVTKSGRKQLLVGIKKSPRLVGKGNQAILWTAKKINGKYMGPSGMVRRRFFAGTDGPQKLLGELKNGNISLNKANDIVKGGYRYTATRSNWITLYSKNPVIGKRTLLREAFTGSKIMNDAELNIMVKYFDTKAFNKITVGNVDEGLRLMKLYESKANTLSVKQKKLFELMINKKELSAVDMEGFIKNIKNADLSNIPDSEIKNIAKELGKDVSILDDAGEVNKRIKEIRQATENVVENLTAAQKHCKNLINSQITILERQLVNAKTPQAKGVLQTNINELKPFLNEIKNFPDDEIRALNKVFTSGTDVKHISRILAAEDPITLLKKINAATNVTEFESALRIGKLTPYADELKYINKIDDVFKEFKSVASGLDDVALLVKQGGKLTEVVRVLSKIPVI